MPLQIKYIPSFVNAFFIGLFGTIYNKVALWLVDLENHRQNQEWENSLINKIYMFQFINAYISSYLFAFWVKDFYNVQYNLVISIICLQVFTNVAEWASGTIFT